MLLIVPSFAQGYLDTQKILRSATIFSLMSTDFYSQIICRKRLSTARSYGLTLCVTPGLSENELPSTKAMSTC